MKVKVVDIYKHLLMLSIFYMYTKDLWDTYTGSIFKYLFYIIVFFGIAMFALETIGKRRKSDVIIMAGFLGYACYIIYNGKVLSNKAQFSQGILEYILYTFYFLAAVYYIRRGRVELKDFKKFVYLGEFISLCALVEYISQTAIIPSDNYSIYYFAGGYSSFRAKVFCVSPMTLCMMLGFLFLLGCYFVFIERINSGFFIKYSPVILLIGMFCTGSRGPLIGTVGGLSVLIALNWIENPLTKKKGIQTLVAVFAALTFLFVLQMQGGLASIRTGIDGIDNIIKRFSSATDFNNEWGNAARLEIWTEYIGVFLHNFWNGIGIAQTSATVISNTRRVTESGLLKRLVETGIIGLLFYGLGVILTVGKFSIAKKTNDKVCNRERILTISVFVAIGIEDIVLQMFADVMAMYVFWVIIAAYYAKMNP